MNCMMPKTNAVKKIFRSVEPSEILITLQKRLMVIIIMLCIDNNVVLIFNFLPAVNKVQKNIQEMRLPIL